MSHGGGWPLPESKSRGRAGPLRGRLRSRVDKSISHRAVALAALADGDSTITISARATMSRQGRGSGKIGVPQEDRGDGEV